MAFTQRLMTATFELGTGNFGEGKPNTITLTGYRMSATIVKSGGSSMGYCNLRIWGMSFDIMNKLSTLGIMPIALRRNYLQLSAGDATGQSIVYTGWIQDGYFDAASMPDVCFHANCLYALVEALAPNAPNSWKGAVPVATIMATLAAQKGWLFQNYGVTSVLVDPALHGTAWDQMQTVRDHANINMIVDDGSPKTLVIWPMGNARGTQVPIISPATGMIGYPTFTQQGVIVTTEFNPSIAYGQFVEIQSDLKPACGKWYVNSLTYVLESLLPGGQWLTRFEGLPPNQAPSLPSGG